MAVTTRKYAYILKHQCYSSYPLPTAGAGTPVTFAPRGEARPPSYPEGVSVDVADVVVAAVAADQLDSAHWGQTACAQHPGLRPRTGSISYCNPGRPGASVAVMLRVSPSK
eukprot:5089178-Pyramimonas_sp.AAC.2